MKSLSGKMRRSLREGQEEIREDLEWERDGEKEGKILEGREVSL